MSDFETLLKKASKFHGDTCPGIVMGTRMTMAGMRELGMSPFERNRDLIVYVEIDRCATDAIQAITGCSLGHRTLKHVNYGKFAATFVDAAKGRAVRVTKKNTPNGKPGEGDMKEAIKRLSSVPESELLNIKKVSVELNEYDLPGFPRQRAVCSVCGEQILDGRELTKDGKPVCRACAEGAYYT